MADKAQLGTQIRFNLEQLSASNAHHEFEHLCRHVARARIASNILPATGPVSAGGDQGRDFETFRQFLAETPVAHRSSLAIADGKRIVFSCTLEKKKKVGAKIMADIASISAIGTKVDAICYFAAADIPVAKRHALIERAKKERQVELEIFDGQAISELLAESDLFWIAERFLQIPSELYPRSQENAEYEEAIARWRDVQDFPHNYANFSEIRSLARHATVSARNDTLFWCGLLKKFLGQAGPLGRRAIYEAAVVHLLGCNSLAGHEERLRSYFSVIDQMEVNDIDDAAQLLMYCVGALQRGFLPMPASEVDAWRRQVSGRVDALLAERPGPNARTVLLEQRGYLEILPRPEGSNQPMLQDAVPWWSELVEIAERAPLFPLQRFAGRLNHLIGLADPDIALDPLVKAVDELVATRAGQAEAAVLSRDRAIAFRDKGHLLRAINEAHRAKTRWFGNETVRGSILSLALLGRIYAELGLAMAAKQQAFAGAYLASLQNETHDLVASLLVQAADCDYMQGAFASYLELIRCALTMYAGLSQKASDAELGEEAEQALRHIMLLRALADRMGADAKEIVEAGIDRLPIKLVDFFPEDFLQVRPYSAMSDDELWSRCEEQLAWAPFSDLGPVRTLSFCAFGISWQLQWNNSRATTAAAEEFIAAMQVMLADVAGHPDVDPCFLPGATVSIEVRVADISDARVDDNTDQHRRAYVITIPGTPKDDVREDQGQIVTSAMRVFKAVSLLDNQAFLEAFEPLFKDGLPTKVTVGRVYRELFHRFVPDEAITRPTVLPILAGRKFSNREHALLSPRLSPGPEFNVNKLLEDIECRYENIRRLLPITLSRLRASDAFRGTLGALRGKGWKDWHIELAVFNVTVNYRCQRQARHGTPEEFHELMRAMQATPEDENSISVPLENFNEDGLNNGLHVSMLSTLTGYGLKPPTGPIMPDWLADFLRIRYEYWAHDIPHNDIFADEVDGNGAGA